MSDLDEEGGELSPAAKAFLSRHQSTGEPTKEQLERGLQRLAAPAPVTEAKVVPLRRKRPFLPPEVLAAAAVVTLLLGAQGAYLLLRKPVDPPSAMVKDGPVKPSGSKELKAISAAWIAGDYEQVKRLASRECASDECRPLVSELNEMLERASRPGALTPEEKDQLLEFDLKLSGGRSTALSRLLSPPRTPPTPEQLALGERLYQEGRAEREAKNLAQAVTVLEKCVTATTYHPCYRLLGSVYASIATRDQSAHAMEKARQMYELYVELAPPDDEYAPKVRAILDQARSKEESAPEAQVLPRVSLVPGQSKILTIPGLQRVAVGDSSVVDVKTLGADQLELTGAEAGRTTLLVWTISGERHATEIEVLGTPTTRELVAAQEPEPEPEPEDGTSVTLMVADEGMVSFGPRITRVALGDSEIADVEVVGRQIRLKGLHEGRTTLLAWLDNGERRSVLVTVVAAGGSSWTTKVFRQASKARASGNWPQAVQLARQVLKSDPGHAGARALLEEAQGEAREAYLRGYQLRESDPEQARVQFLLVMALTEPDDLTHQKAKSRVAELSP